MNAIIKSIVIFLVVFIVGLVGGAYLISPVTVVERSVTIAAPPEKVYGVAGTLRRFNEWSPWAELDPAAVYSYEGPEQGVGQKMSWISAKPEVGRGAQTVTEAVPNEKIVTELDFGSMGKAASTLSIKPDASGSIVIWGFRSENDGVLERWTSLMFDKWIGADYEKGLAKLKALVEKENQGG
jgi:uncharacterized protein YndB with AHSA1/START domain